MTVAILALVFSVLFIFYSRNTRTQLLARTGHRSSWPRLRSRSASRSTTSNAAA